MVRGRESLAHKCAGTASDKIDSIFLQQREKSKSHAFSDRQHDSLVKERTCDQIKQRDLAQSQYVYHGRISAFKTEYSNTQGLKEKSRMASSSQSFQAVSRVLGSLTIHLFASCLCHQLPQYITWHPDPYKQGTDAMI